MNQKLVHARQQRSAFTWSALQHYMDVRCQDLIDRVFVCSSDVFVMSPVTCVACHVLKLSMQALLLFIYLILSYQGLNLVSAFFAAQRVEDRLQK